MDKPQLRVAHETSRAQGSTANPVAVVGVAVLTHDTSLLEALGQVGGGHTNLHFCRDEFELADQSLCGHLGVALIDASATASPIAELTLRLRSQLPDLVLIVAGVAEHQAALASQITSGAVYRFLHKPVSEQRVRLFLEAATRRHDEEHAAAETLASVQTAQGPATAAVAKPWPQRKWLVGAGVAVAVALVAGILLRMSGAGQGDANAAGSQDPEVVAMLRAADRASSRGEVFLVGGKGAGALYKAALERDPSSARARAGLEKSVSYLIEKAEQALTNQEPAQASRFIDAARALQSDNARVAFLQTQLGKNHERKLLTQARAAAAGGDYDTALSVLNGSTTINSVQIEETRRDLARQQIDERIAELVNSAAERLRAGAYVEPARDSALFYIESARALAPRDAAVVRIADQLTNRVLSDARAAARRGDAPAAERSLRTAAQVGARSAEVAAVRAELVSAQTSQKTAEIARVHQLLEERLGQGHLLTPENDSAFAYLEELQRLDTGGAVYRTAQTSLANALLTQARGGLQRGDLAATERNLNAARDVGVDAVELAAVSNELAETRERERLANSVVGVGTLKRTRYVEPVYPDGAREKNVTGWVDLEFVVMRNGSVAEVRVTGASPAGVFDSAAAAALARWRFAPVLRAGEPVEQRARLRMRFSLE